MSRAIAAVSQYEKIGHLIPKEVVLLVISETDHTILTWSYNRIEIIILEMIWYNDNIDYDIVLIILSYLTRNLSPGF